MLPLVVLLHQDAGHPHSLEGRQRGQAHREGFASVRSTGAGVSFYSQSA